MDAWRHDPQNATNLVGFDAFAQAMQFHAGGMRCLASVDVGHGIARLRREDTPGFVTLAFACELYLKCLHLLRSGRQVRGHKLRYLYNELPTSDRDAIARGYASRTLMPRHEFGEELDAISDTFERWRYIFEGGVPEVELGGLITFPVVLLKLIRTERPDWPVPREGFITMGRLPMADFWFLEDRRGTGYR